MATNRKLGRTTDIRNAMLKTLTTDLILHGKIETTEARAKCEINVLVTNDVGIHTINRESRNIDSPTDVLSFPMFQLEAGNPPKDWSAAKKSKNNLALIRKFVYNILRISILCGDCPEIMTEAMDDFCDDPYLRKKYVFNGIDSFY